VSQGVASAEDIMRVKSQKLLIRTGIMRFNQKPKTGLAFLEENGLVYHDVTPEDAPEGTPKVTRALSLARFLKSSTRLDKKILGDFISRPENVDTLKAFIGLFDFEDVSDLQYPQICASVYELSLESYRGCHARTARDVPASWRVAADRADNGDVRGVLFRGEAG
jgi:hypothetical protein